MSDNGVGRLVITRLGERPVLSHQSYSYPLKIITPRTDPAYQCLCVFLLNYGGGMVSGDVVQVDAVVESGGCKVAFITQGSTKLFKHQQHQQSIKSAQTLNVSVATGCGDSVIALLPDPIQPFPQSQFKQSQTIRMHASDSLVLLDWFTSGRVAHDHAPWQLTSYQSTTQVYVDGKLRLRDAISLDDERTMARRLSKYHCYATLLVTGPRFEELQRAINEQFASGERIHKVGKKRGCHQSMVWAASNIRDMTVCKIAGENAEIVREFLSDLTSTHLMPIVGANALRTLR